MLRIISIRDKVSRISESIVLKDSVYLEVRLKKNDNPLTLKQVDFNQIKGTVLSLKEQLDPKAIAEQAVDLNLKLMKWRMIPGLNLDILK